MIRTMKKQKNPWFGEDSECPFVTKKESCYYLFSNQLCGSDNLIPTYIEELSDFGIGHDNVMIETLPVAAHGIILHKGQVIWQSYGKTSMD